jgi:hypothetical protein
LSMSLTWDEFVSGWAKAHDGYDMRYAPAPKRVLMRFGYQVGGVLSRLGVRPASLMIISVVCSVSVPLLASMRQGWPAIAALAVVGGLFADALSSALTVFSSPSAPANRAGSPGTHAFYQALVERLAEVCWLLALALLGTRPGLIFTCAALVWAQEYVRARAGGHSLSLVGITTVGDRPTRIWLIVAALVLAAAAAPIGPDLAAGVVTMVVVCWIALAVIGLGQLLAIVRKVFAS